MRVITRKRLVDYGVTNAAARAPLEPWYAIAKRAQWMCFDDVRRTFASADEVKVASGRKVTIFNIGGKSFRLLTSIYYPGSSVYIKLLLTHADYDEKQVEGHAMNRRTTRHEKPLAGYMALVEKFPLRPLRSDSDYEAAAAALDALSGREDLDEGETDYLEALTHFVEDYDDAHYPMDEADLSPVDAVKFLMEENGLSRADLGRLLGSASTATMFLNGQRDLSKAHIARLAGHFKVDAGLFMGSPRASFL